MGTGCFDVPADLAPGKYHFLWYWLWASGKQNSKIGKCDNTYLTCWEGEVVAPGSVNAISSPSIGTKGQPNPAGLGYQCTNGFSDNPEPARCAERCIAAID